jgi:hypothetical protein
MHNSIVASQVFLVKRDTTAGGYKHRRGSGGFLEEGFDIAATVDGQQRPTELHIPGLSPGVSACNCVFGVDAA